MSDELEEFGIKLPTLKNEHKIERLQKLNMDFWQAFHDSSLKTEFKKNYEQRVGSYKATTSFELMLRFVSIRDSSAYKSKLKACKDVFAFEETMLYMFDRCSTFFNKTYSEIPYLMFEYLDFVLNKEYELIAPKENMFSFGDIAFDISEEKAEAPKKTKEKKIEMFLPGERKCLYYPTDALEKIVNKAGCERVAERNYKLMNAPFLTLRPATGMLRFYRPLNDGWYMNTLGDTLAKFRLAKILNESLQLGFIISFLGQIKTVEPKSNTEAEIDELKSRMASLIKSNQELLKKNQELTNNYEELVKSNKELRQSIEDILVNNKKLSDYIESLERENNYLVKSLNQRAQEPPIIKVINSSDLKNIEAGEENAGRKMDDIESINKMLEKIFDSKFVKK